MGTITKGFIGREDLARWTGSTTYTYDRGTSTGSTQALTRMGNVVDAVMFGDGTTRTQLVLQNAINESSEERVIELSHGSWVITTSMTIPSYVTLSIPRGAVLTVNGGTFTISGSILAGDYQIFAGVGDVVFSTAREVYAGWWPDWTTAAGVAWTNAIASISAVGGTVRLPGGAATSTTCVDMTSLQGYYWEVVGESNSTKITFAVATHGIDCSGSNHITFKDFTVIGDTTTTPQTGFFFARDAALNGLFHYFYNIIFSGAFSKANVYSYAAEECRYYNCYFNNSEDDSCNFWSTHDNKEGLSSPNITIVTGDQSNSDNQFFGCTFKHSGSKNAGEVDNIILRGALNINMYGSFFICTQQNARSYIYVDNDEASAACNFINIDGFRGEIYGTKRPDYGVLFGDTTTCTHWSIRNGYWNPATYALSTPAGLTIQQLDFEHNSCGGLGIDVGTLTLSNIREFTKVLIDTLTASNLYWNSAYAGNSVTTSTESIKHCSSTGKITIDANLDIDGDIVGDGLGSIDGMTSTVEHHTAGDTLSLTESGSTHSNQGAGGAIIFNLPEASTCRGAEFTFVVLTAEFLNINPDDADRIYGLTNANGDSIQSAGLGNSITLRAVTDSYWVVTGSSNTNAVADAWVDNN
ncbi:hypothetical protein [Neptuniibacter sp.]|uniref:hypothetical protein n=1 Tax=Neptuniibacter sp. TaxID=1962643 RepID=UPI00260F1952|nr:hypothetical protein [Neptuniibacter sp.]MCP4597043.1 hypothetical protein [Neptuniibacter sp.]